MVRALVTDGLLHANHDILIHAKQADRGLSAMTA
jgi:hypothetical protein